MPHQIIYAISQMNLTALESLLSDGAFYQDVPKKRFVLGMGKLFEAFKAHGRPKNYMEEKQKLHKGRIQFLHKKLKLES
jgi:hypothetical protein